MCFLVWENQEVTIVITIGTLFILVYVGHCSYFIFVSDYFDKAISLIPEYQIPVTCNINYIIFLLPVVVE